MPFVSGAQRRWGHTKEGTEALGGPEKVAEWDASTKGKKLPEKVNTRDYGKNHPRFAAGGLVRGFRKIGEEFGGSLESDDDNDKIEKDTPSGTDPIDYDSQAVMIYRDRDKAHKQRKG